MWRSVARRWLKEIQIFYAPEYNYSVGAGHIELDSDETPKSRGITYARLNYLLCRWNLESAQANIFVWSGAGSATGNTFRGTKFRRERGRTSRFRDAPRVRPHRIDTLQLGLAPYKHDYGGIATWFVVQARDYTGGLHRGTE